MLFGGTPFSVVQYSLLKGTLSLDTRHYFQASFSVHFNPQYLGGSVGGIPKLLFPSYIQDHPPWNPPPPPGYLPQQSVDLATAINHNNGRPTSPMSKPT